ncbi:MAG TPA: hypothetical protein VMY42_08060 [Thermoguttaceae bacterium]|nr:hypothetical protein [Thermoguttaceae bacterium]
MKFGKTSSVAELQLISRYEGLRKVLFSDGYAEHLEKPLAYWALPSDRRLPLAFLGRTLRDLLETPFAELTETPGIGQKKIRSFVRLLERAAKTDASELPLDPVCVQENSERIASSDGAGGNGFDPSSVSDVVWSQWRASVIQHGLGDEALGRLAPSLKNMTRVIWNSPLRAYTDSTLAEIRSKKTHGEKRVRAILEVFHSAHAIVSGMGKQDHLLVRIVPRLIDRAEQWIGLALQTPGVPKGETIFENLISPLLEQVRNDSSQQIASLADTRLGIGGPITSVRQAARSMGLTRARVYQLLNEINDIMMVRWPTGRHQIYELREKYDSEAAQMPKDTDLRQFHAAVELFYPGSRRGAAGPLDQALLGDREIGELIEA